MFKSPILEIYSQHKNRQYFVDMQYLTTIDVIYDDFLIFFIVSFSTCFHVIFFTTAEKLIARIVMTPGGYHSI